MKKLFNFRILAAIVAFAFVFGASETLAQKRKPVLKKRTTVRRTVVKKPVVKLYAVNAGTVFRARINETLNSKTAKVGDTFTATVREPVYSSTGVVVIPEGSTLVGRVDAVQPAAKGGKPGAIDASFIELKLPNSTRRAISGSLTDLSTDDAKSDTEGTAKGDKMKHRKVIFIGGGAAGGAILGAAVGGGKGALIGAIAGAAAGFLGDRFTKGEEAEVRSGTEFGVYLNRAISLPKFAEVTP
jgi:hypothetical protein